MPIQFRCSHCRQLMSISRRKAGQVVQCTKCSQDVTVPPEDESASPVHADGRPQAQTPTGDADKRHRDVPDEHQDMERRRDPQRRERTATKRRPAESAKQVGAAAVAAAPLAAPPQGAQDDEDEGFTLRRPQTEFEEMDLTPMVDVTFLLLIFFMITASFSLQKTLAVPPPNPEEKGAQQTELTLEDFEANSIIVQIDEKNVIFVDDEPVSDPYNLPGILRDKASSDQKFELVVDAHNNAMHETVVKVIDAANEAGMQKIRLATRAESSN